MNLAGLYRVPWRSQPSHLCRRDGVKYLAIAFCRTSRVCSRPKTIHRIRRRRKWLVPKAWSSSSYIRGRHAIKASVATLRPTFQKSSPSSKSAFLTSVRGALLSAYSSTPQRWRFCGLVLRQIFARYHQGVKSLALARTSSNQWRSFVAWSTRSTSTCASTWLSWVGHSSSTCAESDLCVDNSVVMLLRDVCVYWCCRDWITVTPSLQDNTGAVAASLARRRPTCPELTPARPRDARSLGTALVASPA